MDRADGYRRNANHKLRYLLSADFHIHVDAGRIADVNSNDGDYHRIDERRSIQFRSLCGKYIRNKRERE